MIIDVGILETYRSQFLSQGPIDGYFLNFRPSFKKAKSSLGHDPKLGITSVSQSLWRKYSYKLVRSSIECGRTVVILAGTNVEFIDQGWIDRIRIEPGHWIRLTTRCKFMFRDNPIQMCFSFSDWEKLAKLWLERYGK